MHTPDGPYDPPGPGKWATTSPAGGHAMQPEMPTARAVPVTVDDSWPRVEAAARRRAERARLGADETEAVLFEVYTAALRRGAFRSSRGAERFGVVVAARVVNRLKADRREAAGVRLVPLDAELDAVLSLPADQGDAPGDRAVLRAGFDRILEGLDPPPSATDLRALWHPTHPPAGTIREQRYWSVRLHRIRRRMRDDVRDLLAPVVVAVKRLPRRVRGAVTGGAAGSLGMAAVLMVGAVAPGAAGEARASGSEAPGRGQVVALAATGPASKPGLATQGSQTTGIAGPVVRPAPGRDPRQPGPTVRAEASLWRSGGTAGVTSQRIVVRYEGSQTHGETRVEVYCNTPTRERVCELIGAAGGLAPTGSTP